jgi:hypothetical protein
MSWLLRADLEAQVSWSEIESMEIVARIAVDVPRWWSGGDTLEQVLCASGNEYVLFTRRAGSGGLSRVGFERALNGREMRLTEWLPGELPVSGAGNPTDGVRPAGRSGAGRSDEAIRRRRDVQSSAAYAGRRTE